jgi:arylsulfatase A-like enzyme
MISTSMAWGLRWPTVLIGLAVVLANASAQEKRPNILLALADDWNWPHSETADVKVVRTPVFDRVCREGVRFSNAYVSSPSCTSSRCAILTGQWHWRLEEAANLGGQLQEKKFPVYPELLGSAGYHVGMLGKGPDSRGRDEPPGPRYKDFDTFMAARPADKPFVLWFGSRDPHRPYQKGGGIKSGMKPEDVQVPACLPDSPEVRSDLCDYYLEIQRFDAEVGDMIRKLELAGELENTIMVMTGDNGLPFPRCKSNLYDTGAKVPLAIRWGSAVKGARVT